MSEETNHIPETDKQLRAKKRKRRVRFAILYPAILIALSFLCFFCTGLPISCMSAASSPGRPSSIPIRSNRTTRFSMVSFEAESIQNCCRT